MKYLKLLGPLIVITILMVTVKPLLETLFPCLQVVACDLNPISNQALVYALYGLLTGEQIRLLAELGVFALVGLAVAKRKLLLWNFVLYVSIAAAHALWVIAELAATHEYAASGMFVLFVFKAIVLYGVMFALDALLFSWSGDGIPLLQRARVRIARAPLWQCIAALAVVDIAVVLL